MHRFLLGTLLALLFLGGCANHADGPAAKSGSDNAGKTYEQSAVQYISAATLKWDETQKQPRLDGLRLEVTAPEGWDIAPYDPNHVVSFTKAGKLPRIVVDAEFSPLTDMDNVDEDNLQQFASAMKEELTQKGKQLKDDRITAMVIGERPCIRYETGGRIGKLLVDRQLLITHVNGRRYTIDLRARRGQLETHHVTAYAVLAEMKFSGSDDQSVPETTETTESTETDAQKAPPDAKQSTTDESP